MFNNNNIMTPQRNNYFTPNTISNNIIWVQGIEGAKAWQLSPNNMVILLDSEIDGKMYIKVSDNIGMCTLRIFNYTEETPTNHNEPDLSKFVTKDELTNLIKEIIANEQIISTTSTAEGNTRPEPKVLAIAKK